MRSMDVREQMEKGQAYLNIFLCLADKLCSGLLDEFQHISADGDGLVHLITA